MDSPQSKRMRHRARWPAPRAPAHSRSADILFAAAAAQLLELPQCKDADEEAEDKRHRQRARVHGEQRIGLALLDVQLLLELIDRRRRFFERLEMFAQHLAALAQVAGA